MKIFLYGKDSVLSKLEIRQFFKKSNIVFTEKVSGDIFDIFEFQNENNINFKDIIFKVGGTLRIAEFISENTSIYENIFESYETFLHKKYNYALSSIYLNEEERETLLLYLKSNADVQKAKAVLKHPEFKKDIAIVDPKNFNSWKLNEGIELICIKYNEYYLYGHSITSTDPRIYKQRDERRPSRFFTHGTSVRIAQMMINILAAEQGSTVADPFCGTGTFLIESLIQGYNALGIDNELELVNSSIDNLNWARKEYKLIGNYEVIKGDARKTSFNADYCAFEPYMGPFLKKLPNMKEAQKIVGELNLLYFETFNNLAKNLKKNTRVVCILPDFMTDKNVTLQVDRRAYERNGFKLLASEIPYESKSGSLIKRNIFLLGN